MSGKFVKTLELFVSKIECIPHLRLAVEWGQAVGWINLRTNIAIKVESESVIDEIYHIYIIYHIIYKLHNMIQAPETPLTLPRIQESVRFQVFSKWKDWK